MQKRVAIPSADDDSSRTEVRNLLNQPILPNPAGMDSTSKSGASVASTPKQLQPSGNAPGADGSDK